MSSVVNGYCLNAAQILSVQGAAGLAQQEEVSYEDICRAHIEEFIAAAAAAETQTALGARVSDWRTKIGPVLEEQVRLFPLPVLASEAPCVLTSGGQTD